jgi:hypothetical protein
MFAHHRHHGECRLLNDVTLGTHGLTPKFLWI